MSIVNCSSGYTLLELMLVMALLVIFATMGWDFYANYANSVELEGSARILISDIRGARDRAMNGDQDRNWGVRLTNGSDDYYEIFSSPTDYVNPSKTVTETVYLKRGIGFGDPGSGLTKDILFTKISATTTATTTALTFGANSKPVSVSAIGLVE